MAVCVVCGNDYDKSFVITTHDGERRDFDSFECAIHAIAPTCAHCGCKIIGHGLEIDGTIFCCAHCARHEGAREVKDRA
jgi:Rieske Fe-S protein